MAEFCKDCFENMFYQYLKENDELIISNYDDLCEGCGKIIPIVEKVVSKKD